jgi:mycofactocin precursor
MTNPPSTAVQDDARGADDEDLVEEDLLVEEISIDGMCGVY